MSKKSADFKVQRSTLDEAWQKFKHAVSVWEGESDRLMVMWRGQRVRVISEALQEAIGELAVFINRGHFHPDCYGPVLAMDEMVATAFKWAEDVALTPETTDPGGGHLFWATVEDVDRSLEVPLYIRPEPIEQLLSLDPPVSYAQICDIYGWVDEHGRPEEWKVAEERKSPGTHLNDKWVHPEQKRREDRFAAQWKERCEKLKELDPETMWEKPKEDPRAQWSQPGPAPESIEELLMLPNMTVSKIAEMKQITVDEVIAMAVELRIPIDHGVAAAMQVATTDMERRAVRNLTELQTKAMAASVNTYADIPDVRERIWLMLDDNVSRGLILTAIRKTVPAMTYEDLLQIIAEKPGDGSGTKPATGTDARDWTDAGTGATEAETANAG